MPFGRGRSVHAAYGIEYKLTEFGPNLYSGRLHKKHEAARKEADGVVQILRDAGYGELYRMRIRLIPVDAHGYHIINEG